jgi:hypothetical protein
MTTINHHDDDMMRVGGSTASIALDNSALSDESPSPSSSSSILHRYSPRSIFSFLRERTHEHYTNLTLSELSGSLGDLGTFIPLTVALARQRKIALAPALFWAGLCNIITGYMWDVPMCVQPMKSIAAVALTDISSSSSSGGGSTTTATATSATFDAGSVTTACILSGIVVLFLGVTNLMEVVNMIVPMTVVCGLQIGVGLRLASTGIRDIQKLSWVGMSDCILLAIGCALLSMVWLRDNENGTKTREENGDGNARRDVVCGGESSTVNESLDISSDVANNTNVEEMNDSMEIGRVSSAHQLETAATLFPRSEKLGDAQQLNTTECSAFSTSQSSPTQHAATSSKLLRMSHKVWNRACCCLNPFPATPHPVGIYLFLIGCIFAAITLANATADSGYDLPLHFFGASVVINALADITAQNWRQGFFQGTLPQLPLTTLNSVISVCCLAHALYPEKRDTTLVQKGRTDAVVTRREVCISVGLMNLLLCPLGSMPNCHGAGGLAGQHRFGARHGTSVVVLGLAKMAIAVFLGGSALTLLDALPVAVLGIMLVIAGLELVGTGVGMLVECIQKEKDMTHARIEASGNADRLAVNSGEILRKNTLIAMVTAGVIVALQQTHYGAISGWVVHMVYGDGCQQFFCWLKKWRPRRRSANQ